MNRKRRLLFGFPSLVLAGGLLAGCASTAKKTAYSKDEVLETLRQRMPKVTLEKVVIPYEIDDEIRALAHKAVENLTDDRLRTKALVEAIISRTGLSISYDWLSNKTAREVFYQGLGNCLAYTNLFVGMAREVGLDAVYVDVVTIEKVTREAEVIVNNGHITAGVRLGPDLILIDFTRTPEREYAGYVVIDDLEAIANYYNNQGFLYGYFTDTAAVDEGFDPAEKEIEMYRMALSVYPNFTRALNNLGVALKRKGQIEEAIKQYRKAIALDPDFAEAHSNLGAAYYSLGRMEEAIRQFEIAAKKAGSNAYFYHHLGVLQFQQGQYKKALKQFRKALSRKSDLSDARYYLAECYLKLGDTNKAIREYQKTLEIDPNYLSARSRLDSLVAASSPPSPKD